MFISLDAVAAVAAAVKHDDDKGDNDDDDDDDDGDGGGGGGGGYDDDDETNLKLRNCAMVLMRSMQKPVNFSFASVSWFRMKYGENCNTSPTV